MKMYLDISNIPRLIKWPANTPNRIPIGKGMYEKYFDIIESEMPLGWREKYNEINSLTDYQKSLPLGIDLINIPKGAKIIVE